jgi:hypothetical protein
MRPSTSSYFSIAQQPTLRPIQKAQKQSQETTMSLDCPHESDQLSLFVDPDFFSPPFDLADVNFSSFSLLLPSNRETLSWREKFCDIPRSFIVVISRLDWVFVMQG